ncbi:hypothetical protein [Actinomadura verrucosospora]|uniref:Sulfotransferase family protein n=1 Tax=Actinomadura verrucosospora TaxID=46165 RepID=A0A7D3ZNB4_ACTVE|nr:hypothetical protein [Actinomadura verrucosospora]QKG24761.1 hypothetical protein ACTIVE_6410 [Actinomadura verrucosospora]
MASKVILHIGQQKSGTTYLQDVLGHIAEPLAQEAGILYPDSIREILPDAIENHERATRGLLGDEYPWVSAEDAAGERDKWLRLMDKVRAWPGTVLLSAEALSVIRSAAVVRLLGEFGAARVEVVITTRRLDRSLPSLWQQHVRNGRHSTIEEYFEALVEQRERGPRAIEEELDLHLWRAFGLGGLVRRWAAAVGPDRIRVVINPGSPPDLLWRRFAAAVGARHCAGRASADVRTRRTHGGLTSEETELMVALNRRLDDAGWSTFERRALREEILLNGLLVRDERGGPVALPASVRDLVTAWAEEDLAALARSGVDVVGRPDELRPAPEPPDVRAPASSEQVAEAAAAAIMAVAPRGRYGPEPRPKTLKTWVRTHVRPEQELPGPPRPDGRSAGEPQPDAPQ